MSAAVPSSTANNGDWAQALAEKLAAALRRRGCNTRTQREIEIAADLIDADSPPNPPTGSRRGNNERPIMTACNPITLACTPQLALTLAEGLLDSTAAGKGKSYTLWTSYATLPLAGLLYAAHQHNLGVDWVLEAAANTGRHMPPDEPGWATAAQLLTNRGGDIRARSLAAAMTRATNMEARQRATLTRTVVDALAGYAPRETGEWR